MNNGITTLIIIGIVGSIWIGCLLVRRYIEYNTYDKKVPCIHCNLAVPKKGLYKEYYCTQECYFTTPKYSEWLDARKEEELQLQITRAERRLQEERKANLSQWNTLTGIKYQHEKQNDFSEPFCNLVRGLLSKPEDFDITVMFSEIGTRNWRGGRKHGLRLPAAIEGYTTYKVPEEGAYYYNGLDEWITYKDIKFYLYNLCKLPLEDSYLQDFTLELVHKPSKDTHTLNIEGNHNKEDTWLTSEERLYLLSNVLPEYIENYLTNKDAVEELAQALSDKYNDSRYKRDTLFMLENNPSIKVETILAKLSMWKAMYLEEDEARRVSAAEQKVIEDKEQLEKQVIADQKREALKAVYKTYEKG